MSRQSRTHRKKHRKKQGVLGFLNISLLTLSVVLAAVISFVIYSYQLLQFNYLNYILIGLILLLLVLNFWAILAKRFKVVTAIVLASFIFASLAGLYVVKSFIDVSNTFNTTARFSQVEMSVVVPKDSPINDVKELEQVMAPRTLDQTNIDSLLTNIQDVKNHQLGLLEADSYASAYDQLQSGQVKAMILNEAYGSLLESAYPDYKEKIKTIYTYQLKKEVKPSRRQQTDPNVMTVYISGIDTYGPISTVSRSDVNILMTINRTSNKILLTTTPRDSYVAIAGGGQGQMDKLTHAGIYGVEASIETLENLYDIPIDYYAKINFTSFLNLIDVLGGIEVTNDQEFTSLHGQYHFPVGKIQLDSEKALGFVRERYSLEHGDNDRGKNQMKVIAAIIDKLTSIQALANYQQIISGLGDSVQTSMPLVKMMELANDQLSSGRRYEISSQALEGVGTTGQLPSYAMPGASLYMLSIDDQSLTAVKEAIKATIEGR